MDTLWTPWRFRYVSEGVGSGCPFCKMARADPSLDRQNYILYRAKRNFAFLNLYPYTAGHMLIAPYQHVPDLGGLEDSALHELASLGRHAEAALKSAYRCEGLNIGINLGKCAGAGVAGHLHMHCLPRWTGDANFMSVIGETRVLPEDLETTYDKLVRAFR